VNEGCSRWRGRLIAFEGIDGAGKSTQARHLAERWTARGREVLLTREPTDGIYGKRIREAAARGMRLPASEELELFGKDRAEHVDSIILPALERGQSVITDRYFLSTAAYQGARGLDPDAILESSEERFPTPDCALILEIDTRAGLGRVGARGARDAFEHEESLSAVAALFDAMQRDYIARVNATRDELSVRRQIEEALLARGLEN